MNETTFRINTLRRMLNGDPIFFFEHDWTELATFSDSAQVQPMNRSALRWLVPMLRRVKHSPRTGVFEKPHIAAGTSYRVYELSLSGRIQAQTMLDSLCAPMFMMGGAS